MPIVQPYQPGPDPTPDPTLDPTEPRAVYRRYRPGEADPTQGMLPGDCPAVAGAYSCTRPAGHPSPQHVAGGARLVLATWTGDGADLAVWDGSRSGQTPDPVGHGRPAEGLGGLVEAFDALSSALARCRPAAVGDLELLASLELPYSTVVALPGESAREVAARHGLTLETVTDPGTSWTVTGYRFFGEAVRIAALLQEVARVRD